MKRIKAIDRALRDWAKSCDFGPNCRVFRGRGTRLGRQIDGSMMGGNQNQSLPLLGDAVVAAVENVVANSVADRIKSTKESGTRERSRRSLLPYNARVLMYDELLRNAYQAYDHFLKKETE